MSLQHLTLGERIVMAARFAAVEHLRQEADAAGISLERLHNQLAVERSSEHAPDAEPRPVQRRARRPVDKAIRRTVRQDMFRQPEAPASPSADDDRRVA